MILFKFVSKENLSPPVKKTKRRRSLLALAGHQPAAGQDEEQDQDHQPDWRSPLGALEQVADARLRLPGGAGERGGERGARGGSVHGGISFF